MLGLHESFEVLNPKLSTPYVGSILVLLLVLSLLFTSYSQEAPKRRRYHKFLSNRGTKQHIPEPGVKLTQRLLDALPGCVTLPSNLDVFESLTTSYWAKQESEVVPACIVRPENAERLSTAVAILNDEFLIKRLSREANRQKVEGEGLFAVRSGGRSPIAGSASIQDGALIDLTHFSNVVLSEDRTQVTIGAGARWGRVYDVLDANGLSVAGGRNSAVGVGGLVLGGGISFFSQRYGLVCSNVLKYEIVLASGSITTASATANPDLWHAIKGGGNNFGIVTRITLPTFPCGKIWAGFLYLPSFQASRSLAAFHDFVDAANPHELNTEYDSHASGPIACFTYLHQIGIQAIAIHLMYTKAVDRRSGWPDCWRKSSLSSLWRMWSTCKVRTLKSTCDEMLALGPPGRRQYFSTTTIKNDSATLQAVHTAYKDAIVAIKTANIKGMSWTLVIQPLLPDWVRKGSTNPLGLQETMDGPLVLVSFTVEWRENRDDASVEKLVRAAIEQIDAYAQKHGTGHRYRYMNYCGPWQKPFKGYGEENHELLRHTSRKYDPNGLFQYGCTGGFKLGLEDIR